MEDTICISEITIIRFRFLLIYNWYKLNKNFVIRDRDYEVVGLEEANFEKVYFERNEL